MTDSSTDSPHHFCCLITFLRSFTQIFALTDNCIEGRYLTAKIFGANQTDQSVTGFQRVTDPALRLFALPVKLSKVSGGFWTPRKITSFVAGALAVLQPQLESRLIT